MNYEGVWEVWCKVILFSFLIFSHWVDSRAEFSHSVNIPSFQRNSFENNPFCPTFGLTFKSQPPAHFISHSPRSRNNTVWTILSVLLHNKGDIFSIYFTKVIRKQDSCDCRYNGDNIFSTLWPFFAGGLLEFFSGNCVQWVGTHFHFSWLISHADTK